MSREPATHSCSYNWVGAEATYLHRLVFSSYLYNYFGNIQIKLKQDRHCVLVFSSVHLFRWLPPLARLQPECPPPHSLAIKWLAGPRVNELVSHVPCISVFFSFIFILYSCWILFSWWIAQYYTLMFFEKYLPTSNKRGQTSNACSSWRSFLREAGYVRINLLKRGCCLYTRDNRERKCTLVGQIVFIQLPLSLLQSIIPQQCFFNLRCWFSK